MSVVEMWHATGKRKSAVARIWMKPGTGKIVVRKWRRLPKGSEVRCPHIDRRTGEVCDKLCDFNDTIPEGSYGVPKCPVHGKKPFNFTPLDEYFGREVMRMVVQQPFDVTKTNGQFDIWANVRGGGEGGQAGAIKHGISKALLAYEQSKLGLTAGQVAEGEEDKVLAQQPLRTALKRVGFLTRDARVKERKKYGQPGARKKFQYSKR